MLLAECVGSAALSEVCCLCMLLVIIMPPPLIGRGIIMMAMILSDVCLSVAYIGPKSRTERPRKTKIGSEVAHVTRDSDTTFKVKRSTSPGRFTHCGVNASASCSGECGNVLTVGTYCYVAGGARRFSAHGRRRVAGHIVATTRLQLVIIIIIAISSVFFHYWFGDWKGVKHIKNPDSAIS